MNQKIVEKYTKEEMAKISLGIATKMADNDVAVLIGTNSVCGDHQVLVFEIHGVRVAVTNGDPAWEEMDPSGFAALLAEESVSIFGD